MARKLSKKQLEQAAVLHVKVQRARSIWLGRCVKFVHLLDDKVKLGCVTEVTDDGTIVVDYQLIPGTDDAPGTMYVPLGCEVGVLMVVGEE